MCILKVGVKKLGSLEDLLAQVAFECALSSISFYYSLHVPVIFYPNCSYYEFGFSFPVYRVVGWGQTRRCVYNGVVTIIMLVQCSGFLIGWYFRCSAWVWDNLLTSYFDIACINYPLCPHPCSGGSFAWAKADLFCWFYI